MSADPMIHVPEPPVSVGGVWLRNRATGEMHEVDAHIEAGSVLWTAWPVMTRHRAYVLERAVDRALSAADPSRVFRTLRGVGREVTDGVPSAFWDRVFGPTWALRGAASFSLYFGHDRSGGSDSRAGLVIDDAADGTDVTGFARAQRDAGRGRGPGGGGGDVSQPGHGGHGTAYAIGPAEQRARHGPAIPAAAAIVALVTGVFDATNLGMGGAGGSAAGTDYGGDGGPGHVRVATGDISESMNRDLRGQGGTRNGGRGSGGGYYAVGRRGFTLAASTLIDLRSVDDPTNGNGRATLFTVDDPVIDGTFQGGVLTEYQLYPSRPRGAVRVSG